MKRAEVSRPALFMLLDGNLQALATMLGGYRDHPAVRPHFERADLPIAA